MPRDLQAAAVVVTGASSGIGRAAALAFAEAGAHVVCAARREPALAAVAEECTRRGGHGVAVPTDVTVDEDVAALGKQALTDLGRIDVWVNNAAVSLFGPFEEAPADVYDRVIDTNLGGCIRGARAALPVFRRQGSGVLVNVSSVLGRVGAPYVSAYVASKFASVGLSESLRMELTDIDSVHVCTVLPASIDTPIFNQAANYAGRGVQPLRPVYDAEIVAERIVDLARHPRPEVIVGNAGRALRQPRLLSRRGFDSAAAHLIARDHFTDEPAPASRGNVDEPEPEWDAVSGGWSSQRRPLARLAAPAALMTAAGFAAWRWRRARDQG